jgi:hypothetical protein
VLLQAKWCTALEGKKKQNFAKPHCVDGQSESANSLAWRTHKHQVLAVSSFALFLLLGKGL